MTNDAHENTEPLPPPAAPRIRPLLYGVALLVCGAAIGSGATMLMLRAEASRAMSDPAWMTQRAVARLERDLDLTTEQTTQVQGIFEAHRERVQAFRAQHGDHARQMFRELQVDIESVLTPEQAEKFRARLERAREHAFRHHDGRRGNGEYDGRRRNGPSGEREGQRLLPGDPPAPE